MNLKEFPIIRAYLAGIEKLKRNKYELSLILVTGTLSELDKPKQQLKFAPQDSQQK